LFVHFADGVGLLVELKVHVLPAHFTITHLYTPVWTLYPSPCKPKIKGGLTATIVQLYAGLAVVESPLRLLLVSWVSHIVRACTCLWLIYELGLHHYDGGNLGTIRSQTNP